MSDKLREAAQAAYKAMIAAELSDGSKREWEAAVDGLKAALAESAIKESLTVAEPVAWELRKGKTDRVLLEITNNQLRAHDWKCSLEEVVPLYAAPQPQQVEEQEPFGYFQYATHLDAWVQNRDSNKGVAFYTTPQPQQAEKQEPAAWMCSDESLVHKGYSRFSKNCEGAWNIPVYTTPQPQQEKQPYAFEASMYSKGGMKIDPVTGNVSIGTPQPQREWVGLTEQQIIDLFHEAGDDPFDFTCAIEAKLKEKNT
jgi:hypothetical protein